MMNRTAMLGADVDLGAWGALPLRALLFGEAQGRIIVSTPVAAQIIGIAKKHGVPAREIGTVRDHQRLTIKAGARTLDAPLSKLADAYHEAIPRRMMRSAAQQQPETVGA